ncbi:DMAP1-binding domain-containing protein [Ditylenchus destructor]|uniref:DMAP1-binding domain-containing protein n=1 Tax=Ditylenchus destructor TaxID=166010 RepID=A0AAD4R5M3_9BILA|nr:DMAP1-binding domain-containing protein [Ditylenchus destructor]
MRILPEIANLHKLPEHVRTKLAQLDLELSEGDITEKGYEKKRRVLLAPYVQSQQRKKKQKADAPASKEDTSTEANKQQGRSQRRLTRNESRYHSEIRKEAVQQALAAWSKRQNDLTPTDMFDASTPVTSQGDSLAEPNNDTTTNAHPSTVVGSIRAPISRRPTSRSRSKGRKQRSLSKATAPVATNSGSRIS